MHWTRTTAGLLAFGVLLPGCASLLGGLSPDYGVPVFQHFSEKNYGASPQNWSAAQDHRGVMYFGNTNGILEYDGFFWRLIPLDGVKSVASDDRGNIFVGATGQLGRLQPDSTGTAQFRSLLNLIPQKDRQFGQVLRVLPSPQGVYFSTNKRLFRLNSDGTVRTWNPTKKFSRAAFVNHTLYVQSSGEGLMRITLDDRLELVPGGEPFAGEVLQAAVNSDTGGILASPAHLYRVNSNGVTQIATPVEGFFKKNIAESMLAMPDGDVAVGTRQGGMAWLHADASLFRIFTSAEGYLDNLTCIFKDNQGGVWLTGERGITRFNPGLSSFPKQASVPGNVWTMIRTPEAVYAGTTEGVFKMKTESGKLPEFWRVEGGPTKADAFVQAGSDLLVGAFDGVYSVSGLAASQVLNTNAILDLRLSVMDTNVAYAAGKPGVLKLRRTGGGWEKVAEAAPPGQEFRSVLEDPDGRVWATTRENIWRFDFSQNPVKTEKFTAAQGSPGGWANVRTLNGHVVFATTKGLRQYSEKLKRFAPDSSLGDEYTNGSRDVFNVFNDPTGNVWVTGEGYHDLLLKQPNGYKRVPMPLIRSGIDEIYWMTFDPDGTAWVSGSDWVLYRWDRALYGNPDNGVRVLTRRIEDLGANKSIYGGAGTFSFLKLPWQSNALRFEFSAPFYEEPSAVQYRFQLEGSDQKWSAWNSETRKDYTHLPEGSYKFRVQARTPHGATSEDSTIAFGVLPPWYRSWWAYSIYLIFGAFGVVGIVRWRTKQLEEDKRKLEVIVEERTVEIREQRDEIQVQEQKSRELLLNILPVKVADELKSTGVVKPMGFDDVTVCFTDFVGFTLSSEKLAPGKLVDSLNEYFTAFDEIIARYGLEKLKTIGDSYMFASGLPAQRKSHAVDAVLAAMEMVEVVERLAGKPDGTKWGIRVGLHSGPVVAGVVGIRKFAFDIWGNTVNFAARMESSGVPGHVNMSERTQSLLNGLIETEFRGDVKIKEGRYLPMYLAVAPTPGDEQDFARRYEQEFGETPRSFPVGVLAAAQR